MDRHSVRYLFEHRLLPKWFFEDKMELIAMLLHDKKTLPGILSRIFEKEGLENPYTEDQFNVEPAKLTDEIMMLKLTFPEPEEEPLCYCAYLFFDKDFKKPAYYSIEKGNEESGDQVFVCSWTAKGKHVNHGTSTLEDQHDFLSCVEVYMR